MSGSAAGALLDAAAQRLTAAGSGSGRLDAQLLLGKVTGWARTALLAHPERQVPPAQVAAFEALVARRARSEPIAYLLGEREFYGRTFKVDRRALIPRPETELLVDLGLAAVARWRAAGVEPRVVELGTGAGAVAISLAAAADVRVIATDLSPAALSLASENVGRHSPRVAPWLIQADLLAGLRGPLHVVLGNLPYVPSQRQLPADVANYEPRVALFGGPRGTELIQRALEQARDRLAPGGELCLELDEEDQARPMADQARAWYPAAEVSVCQDGGGYDRVLRVVRSTSRPTIAVAPGG